MARLHLFPAVRIPLLLPLLLIFAVGVPALFAQTPQLRHVMDIHALIEAPIVGDTLNGCRQVTIPISGGEITGLVSGSILKGGADSQLVDEARKKTRLRAVYEFITPDSVTVKVVNEGINTFSEGSYYFMTSPRFECDPDSHYGWLNDRIFICRPVSFEPGGILLRVWESF